MKKFLCTAASVSALLLYNDAMAQSGSDEANVSVGRVVDGLTGQVIGGATIEIADSGEVTETSSTGDFALGDGVELGSVLNVSADGFASKVVTIDRWPVEVELLALATPTESTVVAAEEFSTTLVGRIIDADTAAGVSEARVRLAETGERVGVGADGAFILEPRPPGEFELVIDAPEYEQFRVVIAGDQSELVVEMVPTSLETLVVVGRATQVSRRKVSNSIAKVNSEVLNRVPAENLSQALQGKVAGADIQSNSGAPGGGIQIRLRGISTINGSSNPLYVVDGVFVSDVAIPSGLSRISLSSGGAVETRDQDNAVNRTADLNTYDFEDVQILKGASAAAIYGSKASNGVVVINTKRGKAGDPRIDISQKFGFNDLLNTLGSRTFTSIEEAEEAFGELGTRYFTEETFDNESALASQNGLLAETVLSLSGGSEDGTDYYVSFLNRSDEGIIPGTGFQKQSLRLTLGHNFYDRLDVVASANIIRTVTDRGLTNNDNSSTSHYMVLAGTPNFFDLEQDGEFVRNPFAGSGNTNPLQTAELFVNNEEVTRLITSLQTNWLLFENTNHELRVLANGGVDRFVQANRIDSPTELYFEPADGLPGSAVNADSTATNLNVSANVVHEYVSNGADYGFTTSAGVQYESREVETTYIVSRGQTSERLDIDSGTNINVSEFNRDTDDFGFYIQEEATLFSNLALVGAFRMEKSNANANANTFYAFPKAAVAYAFSGLPKTIDLLKLRFAYGETGNLPRYGQRFTPIDAGDSLGGLQTLTPSGILASDNLKPERQQEFEAGIDIALFRDRLNLDVTVYERRISDLILERVPAPSTGFTAELVNAGELMNRGLEVTLNATPLRIKGFRWNSTTTFAHNATEILDLGGLPPFQAGGFGTSLGAFYIQQGQSATQIVGDAPDGGVQQVGDAAPDFRVGFLNSFQWRHPSWGGFTLQTLLDWQQGGDVINLTELLYDLDQNSEDFIGAGQERLAKFASGDASGYVQDASYLKMRELSLFYDVPDSVLSLIPKAKGIRAGLTARNLFVITGYRGLDPEVSNFGNQAIGRNIDVAPYPPSRNFWFTLQASF